MVSYFYHSPPLSYFTSPFLYVSPHLQVGAIPILSQITIGSISIFPIIFTLENYHTSPNQQKNKHEAGLSQPSTPSPLLHQHQTLGSILWTPTLSSATSGCYLRYKAAHLKEKIFQTAWRHDFQQDAFFTHSKKEGDPITLQRQNVEGISTDFGNFNITVGPIRMHMPQLALPTHSNCQKTYILKQKEKKIVRNSMQIHRIPSKPATQKFLFAGKPKRNQVSILGPCPISPLIHCSTVSRQPPPLFHHSHSKLFSDSTNLISPLSQLSTKSAMTSVTEDEEAFIQQFIGLSTKDGACEVVAVPKKATSSTNWALCLLARIVTDRIVLDGPFAKSMVYAWGVDPATSMWQVEKNCYLIEFNDADDLNSALLGGPWTYRGDLVALRQVSADLDLKTSLVELAAIWVLFLNLPVNAFKDEGIQVIGQSIGTSISALTNEFIHGKRFVKLKIRIKLGEPVKDKLIVPHPTLGHLKVYCSYENMSQIFLFCGKLGHEMAGCHDHARLTMLVQKPGQESQFTGLNIFVSKVGKMVNRPC